VDAGSGTSLSAGLIGRGCRLPPQFGQIPSRQFLAHETHHVHS
jgi:hypothetical protein